MRAGIALALVLDLGMFSPVALPLPAQETATYVGPQFSANQLASISVAPDKTSADKKQVLVSIAADPKLDAAKRPKSFVAMVNGKETKFVDNAGKGTYEAKIALSNPTEITKTITVRLYDGAIREQDMMIGWGCKIWTVPCPAGCKGPIFGGPCVLCFEIECHFGSGASPDVSK